MDSYHHLITDLYFSSILKDDSPEYWISGAIGTDPKKLEYGLCVEGPLDGTLVDSEHETFLVVPWLVDLFLVDEQQPITKPEKYYNAVYKTTVTYTTRYIQAQSTCRTGPAIFYLKCFFLAEKWHKRLGSDVETSLAVSAVSFYLGENKE